ncbi:myoglobin-like [Physella acuta]|uniref:myoglobin-like n=1 Tax=Physella acuta TaxID=109671 RepID=UPI0027DCEC4E|nr:myoglobin-like [Physella acuta]
MSPMIHDGLADLKIDLKHYHVTNTTGFMLDRPLTELPTYFKPWEDIASSVASLIERRELRNAVLKMPLLDHNKLTGHRQLRLAHLQLAMIASGYVWQDGDVNVPKVLPKSVAVPLYYISQHLGLHPILSHVDLALANWTLVDPEGPIDFDNLACIYHLPGGAESDWFCIVTFMAEFNFAKCLEPMVNILEVLDNYQKLPVGDVTQRDRIVDRLVQQLDGLLAGVLDMQYSLTRMHDKLAGDTFYKVIRPFFGGWGGEGGPLPNGLVYEGVSENPLKYFGDTAAQSSTLQLLDALLCVEHDQEKRDTILLMRMYMPTAHKRLIEDIENRKHKLRHLVTSSHVDSLTEAYNKCLSAVVKFRTGHLQLVSKYVLMPARKSTQDSVENLDLKGTGGTSLMPFLKGLKQDTLDATAVTNKRDTFFGIKFGVLVAVVASVAVGLVVRLVANKK